MNKTVTVIAFSIFLTLVVGSSVATAQEDLEPVDGLNTNVSEDNGTIRINWAELDITLAPLEVVPLPDVQLSTGSRGERQTYLHAGESAPWDGVLMNPAAIAYLIAEFEAVQNRARAALERQRESDWNRLRLEVGQLRIRVESDRRQADVVVEGLNREVERRIQLHEDYVEQRDGGFWNTDFGQVLQWGLVVVGSAAVGAVIGYMAAQLN